MSWAQSVIADYGYVAVFVWTFIEGESVFLAAAAMTASGLLDPTRLVLTAAAGAFAGHIFFFIIGRRFGRAAIARFPMLARQQDRVERLFNVYAHWSIFIFQYLYGTRIAAAILFGTTGIAFWRFCLLQAINCLSWAFVIYTAGRLLGLAAMTILDRFGMIGLGIALVVILVMALTSMLGLRRARRQGGSRRRSN